MGPNLGDGDAMADEVGDVMLSKEGLNCVGASSLSAVRRCQNVLG